jgi:predicted dehydrogenase
LGESVGSIICLQLPIMMVLSLSAVADPLKERTDEVIGQYGVHGYGSYYELLDSENIDLMVIASPTPFHIEQALACFERGIDVFMEKPMARSLEEADLMIESMHKNNRKMMVYQPERISLETQAVKSLIESGIIGEIRGRHAY